MKIKNLLFYNPHSGNGRSQQLAAVATRVLQDQGQITVSLPTGSVQTAISGLIQQAGAYDRLICIGGDGTLNAALTGLLALKKRPLLGLIPAGTVNNFATKWKIPSDPLAALQVIQSKKLQSINIGECNGRAIASSLVFGSLAEISNSVRQKDKQQHGLKIYAWQALKQLPKQKSVLTEFYNDSFSLQAKVWICLLSTSNYIGGRKYLKSDGDGLHLSMLNDLKLNKLLNYSYFALTGNLRRSSSLTSFDIKKINIKSSTATKVYTRIDGDRGPALPVRIVWKPDFIRCYVP
jgi:YegS/Rv2252/BmrU family lipid kinase